MTRHRRISRATIRRRRSITIAGLVLVVLIGTGLGMTLGDADERHTPRTSKSTKPPITDPGERATPDPYASMRATGNAKRVLTAARHQLGVEYVYGAQPRDPDGLAAIGTTVHAAGFDCSSFVAYAFMAGIGEWMSGSVAHTDQIWTQGGAMPLTSTAGETDTALRGMATTPPPGGYRPADLLLTRAGSGGYWGHVLMVSERGLVIQSYPPDVYETDHLKDFLARPEGEVGWVRMKSLAV